MDDTSKPILEVKNLRTYIDSGRQVVRAVDGVDFSVRRNETFALLGESGCGKSMTALTVMRLLPDSARVASGQVLLDGMDLLTLPEAAMRNVRGAKASMIFQEPMVSLNPVLSCGEQVAEALRRHTGLRGGEIRRRVLELFDAVGIPDAARRFDEYPFQLSGGLKQRVMIASALACQPALLVADEPTTALDVTIQAQVLRLLKNLQQSAGMSVLLITHDLGVVSENAHRVAVMYAGQIVETADRDRFFSAPFHPYSRKLFAALPSAHRRGERLEIIPGSVPPLTAEFQGCRFANRCDFAWDRCRQEAPGWSVLDGAHQVRCHLASEGDRDPVYRPPAKDSGMEGAVGLEGGSSSTVSSGPLLSVRDLKVHFPIQRGLFKKTVGYVRAVDGISLDVARGQTVALVGESGCGKTTVGKGILQLLRPTAGSVKFDGQELTSLSRRNLRPLRNRFQIIFQDPYASLDPRMQVGDAIGEGMASLGIAPDPAARRVRVDEILNQVGLPRDAQSRYPHEFSGGQRQRIAIARALAVNPSLIVCDEPTSALDVSVQAQILNLLKNLQQRLGIAYLFITHNLAVVGYLADYVAVMYLGRIVEYGTAEELLSSPRHPYTKALLSAVPRIDEEVKKEVIRLPGDLPSPVSPPSGCHFHPRCPEAMPVCQTIYPERSDRGQGWVHCHLYR